MARYLRDIRCYLYTGTQPASYTLALQEAMMTGVPIVSIGPSWMGAPDLFEGHELVGLWSDDPDVARSYLRLLLEEPAAAEHYGSRMRERAIELFSTETVGRQWAEMLGVLVAA